MSAINNKYHVKIGDFGFLLARMARTDRHYYTRKEAPHFVNKFSSGEPNYRDSTFFPHWVQLNWLNGFDQEFFDDGGKFYRSNGVDTTSQLKLTLEKNFSSAGQTASGVNVTAQESLRTTSSSRYSLNLISASNQWAVAADATSLDISPNITLEAYIKRRSIGAEMDIISKWRTDTNQRSYRLWIDSTNHLCFSFSSTGTNEYIYTSTGTITSTSNWVHVALRRYAVDDTAQFVIDGVADGAAFSVTAAAQYNSTARLGIGGHDQGTDTPVTPFDGFICQARIWDTTRSVAEINTNKDIDISGTTPNLSAYYKLNNGYTDETVNANTLTAKGTPTFTTDVPGSYSSVLSSPIEIVGTSTGKIYSWDGATVYTELFDTRRLEWFESGTDANKVVGDTGGTETAQSQGFQVDATCQIKAVQVYLKKNAGTPGNITVRIETDNAGVPSGTLVDATNATATITAFTTATYGWITVEFPAAFSLTGATLYHLVLKTAVAANDNNYTWAADDSSPGYSAGAMSASTDGGSTWSAVAGSDAYFRILGNSTSVNCIVNSDLSGSNKMYFGVGNIDGSTNGDAKIYSYDGTTFVLVKIFNTTNESVVCSMFQFGTTQKMYIGLGAEAKIYTTTDFSTFTLAKTINSPNDPGWVLAMTEYNSKLYVGGGYPQQLPGSNYQYQGFLYAYDEYTWSKVGDFDHTVITCLETFDSLLFIGTIKKKLYVFNTASIDKLFDFPWDVQITDMIKWDDKLAFAIAPTPGSAASGYEGVYLFDRNGFHLAFSVTSRSWYSLMVFKNNLMAGNDDGYIYQTSSNTYISTGWLQSSYDEAQLPSIDKIRRSVTLMFESLPANTSIAVAYKTDESDSSWTTLGTASTDNDTEETFDFAAGVYSKKISFKVTLTTTTSASTPVLKKVIHKYVLAPDFKYMWDMKLLCADNITWLDGEEPIAILETATTGGETSITLKSSNDASPLGGFLNPNGSTMYCSIINPTTGVADRFTYTGLTTTTLTGIPSVGANALGAHAAGSVVRITGGDIHQKLLDLKEAKTLYTFTDIDGLTYTVLFHAFTEENFVIDQDDYWGGLENEVPITLLEA